MNKNEWKKWFGKKLNKSNFAFFGYLLLIVFRPEPLELWLREHHPNFSPETFTYYILMYLICLAVIYIPSMLIGYLRKRILHSG
jgi:ABC-type branched-subunit amino acid transport system permease subunit